MSRMFQTQVIREQQPQQERGGSILGSLFKAASPFMPAPIAMGGNALFGALSGKNSVADAAGQIASGLLVPENDTGNSGEGMEGEVDLMTPSPDTAVAEAKDQKEDPQMAAFLQANPQMTDLFSRNPDMRDVVLAMLSYNPSV